MSSSSSAAGKKRPNHWSRPELLLAFRIYCQQPFGKLHKSNPAIIEVASAIGRTPSAVAMKACNLANLDPDLERKGLGNASNADRELWSEFQADSELVAAEAEAEFARTVEAVRASVGFNKGAEVAPEATEAERTVRVRRVQSFFRSSVLTIYGNRCAITGLAIPQLLTASHIIP